MGEGEVLTLPFRLGRLPVPTVALEIATQCDTMAGLNAVADAVAELLAFPPLDDGNHCHPVAGLTLPPLLDGNFSLLAVDRPPVPV